MYECSMIPGFEGWWTKSWLWLYVGQSRLGSVNDTWISTVLPLTPLKWLVSNFSLQCSSQNHPLWTRGKGNDHQIKKLLIVLKKKHSLFKAPRNCTFCDCVENSTENMHTDVGV